MTTDSNEDEFSGRDGVVSVRVTSSDLEAIARLANEAGLKIGPYMRRRALMQRTGPDPALLKVRELRSVVYQLGQYRPVVSVASDKVEDLLEKIGQIIDEIANDR